MPVEAQVVLTADNSQYDQSMQASAAQTSSLAHSVDSLTDKLNNLAKSAGRKMLGITAADTAVIVGATAAYAAYERQMTSLNVQAAVLTRNTQMQQQLFNSYATQVASVRSEFAMTTGAAAQLVQTINTLSDATAPADKLASSFAKLGNATGESATQLGQSMLQLQRTMGVPQRDTDRLNNQLLVLSQRSGASASSILDFAQNIAPVGRLVNMTQTDIMGFSNAFIRAGQDGYRASNVFNRMVSDIAYATQTGSPELAKYANLVGMTTEQFKNLGGTSQILNVFDAINRQGPQAITTLNRMGYDGMQTVRTVTAMAQQGGMASEIAAARNADPNSLNRGNAAALDTLAHKLAEIRTQLQMTAEAFGSTFARPAAVFLDTIEKMAQVVRSVVDGPLGKMAAVVAGIAAPFLAVGGAIMMASRALSAFAAASLLIRSAPMRGFMETRALNAGMTDAGRATLAAQGLRVGGVGPGRFATGAEAARIAGPNGSWSNRMFYNTGSDLARWSRAGLVTGTTPGVMGRMAGWGMTGAGASARFIGNMAYSAGSTRIPGVTGTGGFDSTTRRWRMFNAGTMGESIRGTAASGWAMLPASYRQGVAESALVRSGEGFRTLSGRAMTYDDAARMNQRFDQITQRQAGSGAVGSSASRISQAERDVTASSRTAAALNNLERSTMTAGRGFVNFGRGMGNLTTMMASTALSIGRVGGGIARNAYSMIGGNPLMLAGIGAYVGWQGLKNMSADVGYQYQDRSGFNNPYFTAGGVAAPTPLPQQQQQTSHRLSLQQAYNISPTDIAAAQSSDYKLQNSALKDVDDPKTAQAKLSATWGAMSSNPVAVNAAVMDLVNKFGAGQAGDIVSSLNSGQSNPFFLASSAAHPDSRGFWDSVTRTRSGSVTTDRLNDLFGIVDDRAAYLNSTAGDQTARTYKGDAMDKTIQAFTGQADYNSSGEPGINFKQAMYKRLFGVDITDSDAMIQYLDPNSDLRGFLRSSITDYGGAANPRTDTGADNLKRMLQQYNLNSDLTGDAAINALNNAILHPKATTAAQGAGMDTRSMLARRTSGLFGSGGVLASQPVDYALNQGAEDPNALYQAVNSTLSVLRDRYGNNWGKILGRTQNLSALAGTDTSMGADVFSGVAQMAQQAMAYRAPFQDRTTNFTQQTGVYQGLMNADMGPGTEQVRQQAAATYQQQVMEQYNYFKQQLYQQREYDISRQRGEDDYNLQRTYAQNDYDLQRTRAEADYQRMRGRGVAEFHRQEERASYDFHLSRSRQEEDFQHQVRLMTEQTARQALNIYQRTPVQQTSSAGWLLNNAQDQLQAMRGQERDLNRLRSLGMNNNTIQQLGLTDPANAQQLARMVSDVAQNPRLIQQFNDEVSKRLKAARSLVTDQSSTDWQEMTRSYRLQRRRAQEDFQTQMARSREDFHRSLDQQDNDFNRSMDRQATDFGTSMDRMETSFNTSMDRAAADLARSAKTIDGNFEDILTKSVDGLSGHAQRQARAVLAEFRNLKQSTDPAARDIMQSLADIFGVDYKAPHAVAHGGSTSNPGFPGIAGSGQGQANAVMPGGAAAGGVLNAPRSVGSDNMHFYSPQHGDLHLAGGEAIMVPEWVDAVGGPAAVQQMNRRARSRQFWMGGVMPLPGASSIKQHDTGYSSDIWAGDLNWPGRADYGKPIVAYKSGVAHPFDYGSDTSYGRGVMVSQGNGQNTLYAHMSAIVQGIAGQLVRAGQTIGYVGDYGNTGSPPTSHLHFELKNGSWNLPFVGNKGLTGAPGSGSGGSFQDLVRKRYPHAEQAAASMAALHPLAGGDISGIINRFAHQRYRQLVHALGRPNSGNALAMALGPTPDEPGGNLDNQGLVRRAMTQAGWANQWPSLYQLVSHESGFRNTAQNPDSTAYGMFQFLNSTWGNYGGKKTSDPWLQSVYGMRYIRDRYHDPNGAWATWQRQGWYGDGSIFTGPQTIGVGERGPEAVIPLNDRGADFIASIISKSSAGNEAKQGLVAGSTPMMSGHTYYNYQIDRSTTFTGAITVQANDPNAFVNSMRQRQRTAALTQPVLAGRN